MTQICHTPDPGIVLQPHAMAVDHVRDLAQAAKNRRPGNLWCRAPGPQTPPFGLRKLPRAWWIGMLAV